MQDKDRIPGLLDEKSVQSIELNVRPALDSLEAAADRAKRSIGSAQRLASLAATSLAVGVPALISAPRAGPNVTEAEAAGSARPEPAAREPSAALAALRLSCAAHLREVAECESEEACSKAHLGLLLCMASQACPSESKRFEQAAAAARAAPAQGEEQRAKAFDEMQRCLATFSAMERAKSRS